jgi:hypothetical protein
MLAKGTYIYLLINCITSAVGYTREAETDTRQYGRTIEGSQQLV